MSLRGRWRSRRQATDAPSVAPSVPAAGGPAGGPVDAPAELTQRFAHDVGAASDGPPSVAQLRDLVMSAARSARSAGLKAVTSGRWLAETALETAGHLPFRDLARLREQHRGLTGDALATELIHDAARVAGAVGAAAGAVAAASELTPATWTALPLELAGETLLVVAVEMKLVAELHEAAGRPIVGTARERAALVATAWSERRGIMPEELGSTPLSALAGDLLGRPGRSRLTELLRRRLIRKAGRNITSFAPFLAGAAAGGALNRRATARLGREVARSLGLRPGR